MHFIMQSAATRLMTQQELVDLRAVGDVVWEGDQPLGGDQGDALIRGLQIHDRSKDSGHTFACCNM